MRKPQILAVAALASILLSACSCGVGDYSMSDGVVDSFEPNDSITTAATVAVNGNPVNGIIAGQPRDMDFFKFSAAAGDKLKITVKAPSVFTHSTLDPHVTIYMPDGKTVVEKDDDAGLNLESEIRLNVPVSGTYTIRVTSFDIFEDPDNTDNKLSNTYQLAVTTR